MKRLLGALRKVVRMARIYWLLTFAVVAVVCAGVALALRQAALTNWVLAIASGIALIPVVVRMVRDIQSGRYGVDILAALAIGTSLILGQFWAAIVIVIMLAGGKSLEDFASSRARSELKDLLRRAPQHAHILKRNKELDILARELQEDDLITIRPGEIVPADALITDGTSSFDESSLTGESLPVIKQTGDQILSGSVNGEGLITARVIHTAANSQYQQIIRLVTAAAEHPAPFVRLADHYSIPFTVVALSIAGIAWILSGEPIRFLEVLVVATPCPLILATPIALIAGMSRASREGIIVKTGTAFELLATAKTFAFDKTGTLTLGKPTVDQIIAFKPSSKEDVLSLAAALEQGSNHVLAAAITARGAQEQLRLPKTKHVAEISGRGLEAHVQGQSVIVGRLSLLAERNIELPAGFSADTIHQTATFVAIGGRLAGYITFSDEPRPEGKSTLAILRRLRIRKFIMLTGDRTATARQVAKQLGISDVDAEMLPGDKLRTVEAINERPVVFVGDGVNDAPVLMAADVGIALGARGSTAASESADIVILKDNLQLVAQAMLLAKRSFRIANQSILIGIGLSIGLMFVFATGRFQPVIGAVVQEAVDVLVIFNALRAHRASKPTSL